MENVKKSKNIRALKNLLDSLLDDDYDATSLPVYGSRAPTDTAGIYSWDDDYFLVARNGWELVRRCKRCVDGCVFANDPNEPAICDECSIGDKLRK